MRLTCCWSGSWDEQVEEEKSLTEIVDHLKMVGGDGTGLLMLDGRLGAARGVGGGAPIPTFPRRAGGREKRTLRQAQGERDAHAPGLLPF